MADARSGIARGTAALSFLLLVGCTSSAAEPEVARHHDLRGLRSAAAAQAK